ncbi:biopolymer transporter ExbD [Carboxylicivirga sp. A043]|uniref:ExbD/TolR family protein n=1 Tax=Carboxylicivirga litoralis TaxID=2816963 RepID=UPI0021CB409A|nr:biopolymer transporter ExbD [Carboxylicivirga sp. A043]MCU4156329.1 biopolymer transporter ExbD [Carboxylicivirga sp. A043]
MAKFRKKKSGGQQAINTASLPDIVFMLLFFFMVSTTMKEVDLNVVVKPAQATELVKLEKKELVTFIYVGVPAKKYQSLYGSEPRIQLNDQFSTVADIQSYIAQSRDNMTEANQAKMIVSIKADKECPMGIITDIKQALRKAAALKLNYSAAEMVRDR